MAKHIHIYFTPQRVRDQAPGSVPAGDDMMKLVNVLMQAIADRQGMTQTADAMFLFSDLAAAVKTLTRDTDQAREKDGKFAKGQTVYTSHRNTPWKGTYHGPDPDSPKTHHLVKVGNSMLGIPHSQVHHTHEAARAAYSHTTDATYVEQDHPRGPGGQWTSGQHSQAAAAHEGMGTPEHQEAAEAHHAAAKHMTAQTGLGAHMSRAAQAASKKLGGVPSAKNNSMGAAYGKLKQIAADPNAPVLKRSEAIKQLGAIEKAAGEVAESPHAIVPPKKPPPGAAQPGIGQPSSRQAAAALAASAEGAPGAPSGGKAVGPKPVQATAKGAKPAVHQLLSSGHPFSVDELMKATGVTNKVTIMTALSDLKNPKYAGQLGALTIEKGVDGMYKVTKAPAGGFKAVGAANAPAGTGAPNQTGAGGEQAGAAPEGMTDPLKVVHGSHPLSDFMPGQTLTAKGAKGTQYKVLGHNQEGHVVVQNGEGMKHNMEPAALKAAMLPAAAKPAAAREDSGVDVPHQPSGTAVAHAAKPVPQPGQPGYAAFMAASTKPKYTYTGEDPKALPLRATPKGDVNSVQNVQARMDAKKAVAANPRTTGGLVDSLKNTTAKGNLAATRAALAKVTPGPLPNRLASALPLRATPKGDVNSVQNVQARMDAKKAGVGPLNTLASRMGGARAPIAPPLKDFNDPSYKPVEAKISASAAPKGGGVRISSSTSSKKDWRRAQNEAQGEEDAAVEASIAAERKRQAAAKKTPGYGGNPALKPETPAEKARFEKEQDEAARALRTGFNPHRR